MCIYTHEQFKILHKYYHIYLLICLCSLPRTKNPQSKNFGFVCFLLSFQVLEQLPVYGRHSNTCRINKNQFVSCFLNLMFPTYIVCKYNVYYIYNLIWFIIFTPMYYKYTYFIYPFPIWKIFILHPLFCYYKQML